MTPDIQKAVENAKILAGIPLPAKSSWGYGNAVSVREVCAALVALAAQREPVKVEPLKVKEWDGVYFCGACNEILVVDDQPYCHKCGTRLACDHGKGFTDYCAPCGRIHSA